MKKLNYLLAAACVVFTLTGCPEPTPESTKSDDGMNWQFKAKWTRGEDGVIRTTVPARPAGQKHVLELKTPKLDVVRVGFVHSRAIVA